MTNFEFWQQAFLAALTAGRPVAAARDIADEALTMLADRPSPGNEAWTDKPAPLDPAWQAEILALAKKVARP